MFCTRAGRTPNLTALSATVRYGAGGAPYTERMAARQLQFEPGGLYHVFNCGVNGERIAFTDNDLSELSQWLRADAAAAQITIVAYNLLPNAYHLLLRQCGDTPVSQFVQRVFNRYSKKINHRHGRSGTLFAGPFKAQAITGDRQLALLCRHVHLLPVAAGLVESPEQWAFGDFREWLGDARPRTLPALDGPAYRRFVQAAVTVTRAPTPA